MLTKMPNNAELMKILDGFDIAGHPRDQVACLSLIVIGEREPLDMVVDRETQIVRHQLTHTGCQKYSEITADGADNRNHGDGCHGKMQDCQSISP